jgi:hypothetical protein
VQMSFSAVLSFDGFEQDKARGLRIRYQTASDGFCGILTPWMLKAPAVR